MARAVSKHLCVSQRGEMEWHWQQELGSFHQLWPFLPHFNERVCRLVMNKRKTKQDTVLVGLSVHLYYRNKGSEMWVSRHTHLMCAVTDRLLSAHHSTHEMRVLHTGEWFHIVEQYLKGHNSLLSLLLHVRKPDLAAWWSLSLFMWVECWGGEAFLCNKIEDVSESRFRINSGMRSSSFYKCIFKIYPHVWLWETMYNSSWFKKNVISRDFIYPT